MSRPCNGQHTTHHLKAGDDQPIGEYKLIVIASGKKSEMCKAWEEQMFFLQMCTYAQKKVVGNLHFHQLMSTTLLAILFSILSHKTK